MYQDYNQDPSMHYFHQFSYVLIQTIAPRHKHAHLHTFKKVKVL